MSPGILRGLCPACLLDQGCKSDPGIDSEISRFKPPTKEELGRLFPQLELLELIGAGGMGAVYKARQPALDRLVALKILPPRGRGTDFSERFSREARALARLNHPHIVAVHEFGQAEDLNFFVMEYVDGVNLRELEQRERLSPREALQIIPQICDALQYAHDQGVVHRDIKPENVLVDRKGRVKIADFGLAKIVGMNPAEARLTAEGQIMGTPHYMAPEQLDRPLAVDHRADIYSLGVVFYEMLTGDLPIGRFAPPSARAQASGVMMDNRMDEIVLRALENDPDRRYQKASEVKQRLETVAAGPASDDHPSAPDTTSVNRSGERCLYWAGIPLVLERNGEREVSFNGALTAIVVSLLCLTAGFLLVRFITGTEHVSPRLCYFVAAGVVVWGIRRTMNQPGTVEAPGRTKQGTVILNPPPTLRYWKDYLALAAVIGFAVSWNFLKVHVINPRLTNQSSTPLVARPSTDHANQGALAINLPERGKVELLALADPQSSHQSWWRPDGSPLANQRIEVEGLPPLRTATNEQRTIILHLADLPAGAAGPYLEFDPPTIFNDGGKARVNGQLLQGSHPILAAFPKNTRLAKLRVGLAWDAWQTIAHHDPQRQTSTQIRHPQDPTWESVIHQVQEGPNGTEITLILGRHYPNWKTRIVAVDKQGLEHDHFSGLATPTEKNETWTFNFRDLPLSAVAEFQVQVRPVHWLEFRNLALQPQLP